MSVARVPVRAERYEIDVRVDPASSTISGRATLDLIRADRVGTVPQGLVAVELWLHPDLRITDVRAAGARLQSSNIQRLAADRVAQGGANERDGFQPTKYRVTLRQPFEAMTLFVEFEGRLWQDVNAGEKPGEIHNFEMRAHISSEGIYLADGSWYPQPAHDEDDLSLSEFTLTAWVPPGFALMASGERDAALAERTGLDAWRSPYPLPSMVLVGGPLQVHRDRHREKDIAVYLAPEHSPLATMWLEAIKRNLDRYEPLIGPFPAREYAVVENFFSSGFAFPCFTLLSSAVIGMGERAATTHGYLDHEMLHSWWGNGVFVDPRDGNWCEALTSYCTNYYGHVLDGNDAEARRKRRNCSHFFSRLKLEDDKPLGTFGRPGGCNRQIAYDKGAMVFHMLARQMGQENFWSAMRRLTDDFIGVYASWETIQGLCEQQTGQDLAAFFNQWVRRPGVPSLSLEAPKFDSAGGRLTLKLRQSEPAFELEAPVRITCSDGEAEPKFRVAGLVDDEATDLDCEPLTAVLDPDFQLLRRVAPDEIVPTTAATRRGSAFACVLPAGNVPTECANLKSAFESSFQASQRIERTAGQIEDGVLGGRCTLILGNAVRDPYVEAFLTAIEFPVTWTDHGFKFDGEGYNGPLDAVLCTIRHPGVPGGGVTVVYANSEPALPRASLVPMYEHSLVIFRDGRPVLRQDFENPQGIQVEYETK